MWSDGRSKSTSRFDSELIILDARDKSPEYALYMLNRQTVKNITLPLVPGEMKLTVVDASTLQVARRGESM